MANSNEQQRSELSAKLQKELEDFVAQLKPKEYTDGWPEDKWEEEMEKHPFFMSKPLKDGEQLPPMVEALQQLKYDPDVNTPEELAKTYKEDGNYCFKLKKLRWAVNAYTKGLQCNCKDDELNAQLYSNRAITHLHIGNYKKGLEDATKAKSVKPGYIKAILYGAQCCFHLNHHEECIAWCEEGLKFEPKQQQLEELKENAVKAKKLEERKKRRAAAKFGRIKKEVADLVTFIKKQKINFDLSSVDIETLEPKLPHMSGHRVHFDDNGKLVWPVLFLYPEYNTTDSILCFHEDSTLLKHLSVMFAPEERPPFDEEQKYKLGALQVYFTHCENNKLIEVDVSLPLRSVLCDKRYIVRDGVPSFFITVKGSKFDKIFREEKGISI